MSVLPSFRPSALFLLLVTSAASPAAAQVEGRWAVLLGGGATGSLRGELKLAGEGGRLRGTIWLQNSDVPVELSSVRADGSAVAFTADADGRLRFTGALNGGALRGVAATDSGTARPWSAAPLSPIAEYYPVLPRFTLRQVIAGRSGMELRLPGPWVAAARAEVPAGEPAAYAALARAAGVAALEGEALTTTSPLRAMGLARRDEVTGAARRTLVSMRAQMPPGAVLAEFDRIFRPRGSWVVDVHDAALAAARAGTPTIALAQAVPALASIGWLPREAEAGAESVALALYRLHALGARDTTGLESLREQMRAASPAGARAVDLLLRGYDAGAAWHAGALRFLLVAPWIRAEGTPASIAGRMRADWRGSGARGADSLEVPAIVSRTFGYPQAVPRYGVPPQLFARIVTADNWSAREWLGRHGPPALLEALRRTPADYGEAASVEGDGETFRLTTVRRQSEEATNGFLEPHDAILIDPAYMPLLALGAVVHEWQHLAFERLRRLDLRPGGGDVVTFPATDPFVAEGLAEWRAERLLAPLTERFPLLGLGEAEKRARLARTRADEQHVLGYAMVRALAGIVPDDARRLVLLLDAAEDPRAVTQAPEVRRAWARFGGPELVVSAPSRRVLIPETTFTIEDGFPDIIGTRIVVPAAERPR